MMLTLFPTPWQELWAGHHPNDTDLGAVFTRPEIVALILDLAGYECGGGRLARTRLLEPSCGDGAFLREIVRRLLASEREIHGCVRWEDPVLGEAIRAIDLNESHVAQAREEVTRALVAAGCTVVRARTLADMWVHHGDFLLQEWPWTFDHVLGNPPYVRIEGLPRLVLTAYRRQFGTLTHRADLYVAFIERGLELLAPTGRLAFICANRFAKNQYGAALRKLIARQYHVRAYLNLEHTQPFANEVSAYPCIIVLDRERGRPTFAATLDRIDPETIATVTRLDSDSQNAPVTLSRFEKWFPEGAPWIATSASEHDDWTTLCSKHPLLERSGAGTRVGIGVATGADRVFVLPAFRDDIESSRQIPLILARDVANEGLRWSGHYLLNPFSGESRGTLVSLGEFPGLRQYLEANRASLLKRYVAKSRPDAWYRTIDRIWPDLKGQPKLIIPDIQSGTTIGLDEGSFYPHHNLYWIASDEWDLRVLKALMRSDIVRQQVGAYSVQMRGGSIRFQAQTLRRVRIPRWEQIPLQLRTALSLAADSPDQTLLNELAIDAFRA